VMVKAIPARGSKPIGNVDAVSDCRCPRVLGDQNG